MYSQCYYFYNTNNCLFFSFDVYSLKSRYTADTHLLIVLRSDCFVNDHVHCSYIYSIYLHSFHGNGLYKYYNTIVYYNTIKSCTLDLYSTNKRTTHKILPKIKPIFDYLNIILRYFVFFVVFKFASLQHRYLKPNVIFYNILCE